MESLFGSTFGGNSFMEGFTHTPSMELYEDNDTFHLNAYVPGLKPEEINLEVLPDSVRIWGETKSSIPEKDVRVHVAHRTHGQFDLRYSLPAEIDAEKVQATYENGVLRVELPKVEAVKPKTVQVKISSPEQK
jgi:HSP20 family protein